MALQIQEQLLDKVIEDKLEGLETSLDTLLRQKTIFQSIEEYTNNRIDFADILETYNLLVEEIERLQQEVRRLKSVSTIPRGRGYEEEEEAPSSSKFEIKNQEWFLELLKKRG